MRHDGPMTVLGHKCCTWLNVDVAPSNSFVMYDINHGNLTSNTRVVLHPTTLHRNSDQLLHRSVSTARQPAGAVICRSPLPWA
jgi:hypothetical protein